MAEEQKQHDSYDEHGYKKRCYCEKCEGTYKEWCKKNKEEGCTHCKRRCYTVCEVICEKPITTTVHWGYHEKYEGKWEPYHKAKPAPKHCPTCKKSAKDCKCGGSHSKSD